MKNINGELIPQNPKISTFGKVWRIGLLWLTSPIWIPLRATVKTIAIIRKWWVCRIRTAWSGLKAKWAIAGEKGLVDIKWYDKKWFITARKILLPIDLAVHIVIGTIVAPFKFIKSFFMSFRTAFRITKDIYNNELNQYCYSNGGMILGAISCIANKINPKNKIIWEFVYPISIKIDKGKSKLYVKKLPNEKKFRKFNIWESTIPAIKFVNSPKSEEDKSILKHIQVIAGLRSMKPISEYEKYIHDDINCNYNIIEHDL